MWEMEILEPMNLNVHWKVLWMPCGKRGRGDAAKARFRRGMRAWLDRRMRLVVVKEGLMRE